jgi:hypothetical protein
MEAKMKRFKFLVFVAVLVGLTDLAYAGFDEGMAAYDRGDYAKAYKQFQKLAGSRFFAQTDNLRVNPAPTARGWPL